MLLRLTLGAALLAVAAVPFVSARPALAVAGEDKENAPTLVVGSDAPALSIEKWVKGSPVASFEKGKTYMVEFWATWCRPCIASMPHLTELQQKYAAQNFTVIGVSTVDERNTLEKVEKMVASKGETMGYTVAWDKETSTKDAFFTAAGQNGIPCSFLVDRNGKIAYIGHPAKIDKTLDDVVNGKHDIKALAERYKQRVANEKKSEELQAALGAAMQDEDWAKGITLCDQLIALDPEENLGFAMAKFTILATNMKDEDKAYAWAKEVQKGIGKDDAQILNALAWTIIDPDAGFARKDLDVALGLATDANTLSKGKSAEILDTLARVHFLKGDLKKAIELQTSAVGLADKAMKKQLEKTLEEYKAAAEKKSGG